MSQPKDMQKLSSGAPQVNISGLNGLLAEAELFVPQLKANKSGTTDTNHTIIITS